MAYLQVFSVYSPILSKGGNWEFFLVVGEEGGGEVELRHVQSKVEPFIGGAWTFSGTTHLCQHVLLELGK